MGTRWISVAAVVGVMTACLAVAVDDPVAERRKLMQENGRLENKANQLVLGNWLPDNAVAAMQKLQANLTVFPTLFPVGSETGGETRASPAIWSDMQGLEALAADFVAKAKAAEEASAMGQEAFIVAWQPVATACTTCHEKYVTPLR